MNKSIVINRTTLRQQDQIMDTLKWIILLVTIPAVLCADSSRKLGDECSKTCDVLHSVCEEKKCICEKNYFELDGECAAGLDAKCYYDKDCKLSNTICTGKGEKCKCHPNFVASPDKSRCLSKLADNCTKAYQCLASNSQCEDGRCQCLPGRSLVNGECVYKLGSYCEKYGDCGITNSDCLNNKCTCFPHYFQLREKCVAGVNASCYENFHCKAENSICLNRKCQCEKNFAATPDYQCLPIAYHHEPCKYDSQCYGALPHTSCNVTDEGQRCECTAKFFFKEGECYPRKYVPDKCDRSEDCFTQDSYCRNGQCACLPSHKLEEGVCNASMIYRPLFLLVALILMGMKVVS